MTTTPLAHRALFERAAQTGRLDWIGVRAKKRADMVTLQRAELVAERGISGDRQAKRAGGKRQVSLVQGEHLAAIAAYLGQPELAPALLRRNLVVSGINLISLKDRRFRIGTALLEGTGPCHPCSRMEDALGHGGFSAMRGHGGIVARVLEGAPVEVGAPVLLVGSSAPDLSS